MEALGAVPEPTIRGGPVVNLMMMIGCEGVVELLAGGNDEDVTIGVVTGWLCLIVVVGQCASQRLVAVQYISLGGH